MDRNVLTDAEPYPVPCRKSVQWVRGTSIKLQQQQEKILNVMRLPLLPCGRQGNRVREFVPQLKMNIKFRIAFPPDTPGNRSKGGGEMEWVYHAHLYREHGAFIENEV